MNDLTYEEAMNQLEVIIEKLEKENTLEETLNDYKKGMELYNHCCEVLKKAEGEVKIILKDNKDAFADFDFIKEDENGFY